MRRMMVTAVIGALVLAACSTDGRSWNEGRFGPLGNPPALFASALIPFTACDGVLDYFKAEALERVGPYGLDGGSSYPPFWRFGGDDAVLESSPATTTASSQDSAGGGDGSYSTTNVQVAGVDEPDIVKTDGTRIISITDGVLRYVDLSSGTPSLVGSLELTHSWGHSLLVEGDRALVISGGDSWAYPMDDAARISMPVGTAQTMIVAIDLSNPQDMKVESTLILSGGYVSARAIDGTVRVVVSSYPQELGFVYPSTPAGEGRALAQNREVILESTIDQWLPSFVTQDASGATTGSGLAVPCSRMHRPDEFAGFSTLSVVTLDLDGALVGGSGTGIIAGGDTVYASTDSLYVATSAWVPFDLIGTEATEAIDNRSSTAIHRFSIDGSGLAQYEASGSVQGYLLNQFSMDEHEGVLRVAVTEGSSWGSTPESESRVVVLEQRDGALVEIGSVGEMGKGEQIFSVRFMGDTAYVVTFRQTDPFYIVDLSDPTNPVVAGELKIDGYSAYLHPIGENLVLGVGQDADSNGMTLGAKATIFDVSDPSNPIDIANWTAPGSYTDAEWDHHAFLAWAPAGIVVLPIQSWEPTFAGAVVLDTTSGLSERGRISHVKPEVDTSDCVIVEDTDWYDTEAIVQICTEGDTGGYPDRWCEAVRGDQSEWGIDLPVEVEPDERLEICWPGDWYTDPPIMRSLVIDGSLWTLSTAGLQANAIGDLGLQHRIAFTR